MAQQSESEHKTHNQPSHEAQVKGGQHSHQSSHGNPTQAQENRSHNQPSHEAQVKGGQHSHSGSEKK
jgi:hypothetical protein